MVKTPSSLYQQIEQYLVDYIKTRNLQPGDRLPPEREIGQQFGASHVPVRQATDALVTKGVVERVHGKGTFVKKSGNGAVKTNTIGILYWPEDTAFYRSPHYNALTGGVKLEAERQEKFLKFRSMAPAISAGNPGSAILDLAGQVDGFLLMEMPPELHGPVLKALAETGKPGVVIADNQVPNTVDTVVFDHGGNSRIMAEFIHGQGHSRAAFLAQKSSFFNMDLYCRDKLTAVRTIFGSEDTAWKLLVRDQAADLAMVGSLLEGPQAPTALICNDDETAFYVLRLTDALGLSVPEDITVTGYDDIIEPKYSMVDLTTIRLPFMELGRGGVQRLLERINDESGSITTPCRVALAGELVMRNSHKAKTRE